MVVRRGLGGGRGGLGGGRGGLGGGRGGLGGGRGKRRGEISNYFSRVVGAWTELHVIPFN